MMRKHYMARQERRKRGLATTRGKHPRQARMGVYFIFILEVGESFNLLLTLISEAKILNLARKKTK